MAKILQFGHFFVSMMNYQLMLKCHKSCDVLYVTID
jgi:hypothetical protein